MRTSRFVATVKIDPDSFLLFNTRTGAVDLVNHEVIAFLESSDRTEDSVRPEDKEAFKTLLERGYITDENEDQELAYSEKLCQLAHKVAVQFPRHIILPTYDCNLRCAYCYEHKLKAHGEPWLKKVITKEEVDRLYDAILDLDSKAPDLGSAPQVEKAGGPEKAEEGGTGSGAASTSDSRRSLTLYGGEPLLWENREIVEYILTKGAEHGYTFGIITNGVDLRKFLPMLARNSVTHVQITLDGPKEIHNKRRFRPDGSGTFDEIVASIDAIAQTEIRVSLRVNVDAQNLGALHGLADLISSKGWRETKRIHPYLSPVQSACKSSYTHTLPEEALPAKIAEVFADPALAKSLDPAFMAIQHIDSVLSGKPSSPIFWFCGACCSMYTYDPHGDVYACWEGVGELDKRIGSYLPKLVFFEEERERWHNRTVYSIPECRTCKWALLCGGGCPYQALVRKGTTYAPHCKDFDAIIEHYLPLRYRRVGRMEAGNGAGTAGETAA